MVELLEPVKKLFSSRTESVDVEDADSFYRKEKEKEIEKAERRADELMSKTQELIEQLDLSLQELKDYEHGEGIQAVEDVAENFYTSRKRMVEKFETGDGIEEHIEQFSDFLEEFNDVSRKEGEVLKYIRNESGDLPEVIDKLVKHEEELEKFIEEEYELVLNFRSLEEKVDSLEDMEKEKERLEDEVKDVDVSRVEQEKKDVESKIENLEESDEWKELGEKKERIEKLEEEKEEIVSGLSRQVSRIERPLKKILYQVENQGVAFNAETGDLRNLVEQQFSEVDNPGELLEEAEQVMEAKDIVSETKEERFREASEKISELDERKKEIAAKQEEIDLLRDEIENMDVEDERQDLVKERRSVEEEIETRKRLKEEKRKKIDKLEQEVEEVKKSIGRKLDNYLHFEVEVEN